MAGDVPGVKLRGGINDYEWDAHDQPIDMVDHDGLMVKTERDFHARQNLDEGINGQCPIDTLYDNTREFFVTRPRSDCTDDPAEYGAYSGDPTPHYNERYAPVGAPNHEGVDNPAPVDLKKHLYSHRRY